jgi:hypothetical protein
MTVCFGFNRKNDNIVSIILTLWQKSYFRIKILFGIISRTACDALVTFGNYVRFYPELH